MRFSVVCTLRECIIFAPSTPIDPKPNGVALVDVYVVLVVKLVPVHGTGAAQQEHCDPAVDIVGWPHRVHPVDNPSNLLEVACVRL